ncbi:TonB-dependent receptor [Pelomonas sp. KK5]|uniref:TonB-dependent receptor n=1 Tax=Pelomonas sp. KK5 TaxID=1855730 RepID=UPI00097BABED|nr:TonB-dependent receptor [Pelomonas sp. KK5]
MAISKTVSRQRPSELFQWSVLAAGIAIGFCAKAQAPATEAVQLDRVEVTSGKRKQLQSEVAGTVTALSGAKLEQLGVQDAEDLFKLSPGVQFNKGNADGALYSIRGIGTNTVSDNVIFGQASTGIYIEDVPFTDPYVYISSPDVAPFDLERVEILRGPQGALYGSASLGGAVRYLFAKPDMKQTHFSVLTGFSSVSGGGTGNTLNAMANVPLSEGVAALRVVLTHRSDPGYVDNLGTGRKDVNTGRSDSVRVILALKPTPALDVTAMYVRQRSRQDGDAGVAPDPDQLKLNAPTDNVVKSNFDLGSVQANWDLGGLRLTSLTGYQTKQRDQNSDLSYFLVPDYTLYSGDGPYPDVHSSTSVERRHSNSFTQELRLAPVTAGDLSWLVGAFHQKARFYRSQTVLIPGANDPVNYPDDIYFDTVRLGTATENSVFGDLDWKVTPKWSVGAGARFFHTQVQFQRSNFGSPFTPFADSEKGTTPKLSTRYQFSPEVAAYATASRGYRYGGINTIGSIPYKSDSLWNYEAGLRLRPSRELSLDLSVFTLDWKNIQVSTSNDQGFVIISNVARARSNGLEATLAWRPLADFSLNGSLAYTDAKIKAGFVSANGRDVDAGTSLPGVAKLQGTLDGRYTFAGPAGSDATASAVLQHVGARRAQLDADMRLPAYTTVDLRLAFAWTKWEVTAYVQNLADSRGQSSAAVNYSTYQNPGAVNYVEWYPIRPRTIGMSLRYDY